MENPLLPLAAAAFVVSFGARAAGETELLGDLVPALEATRTITITPQTQYVNVTKGETVKFVDNGQSFAVHFDGVRSTFELNNLAPAGSLDHLVQAYVAPSADDED